MASIMAKVRNVTRKLTGNAVLTIYTAQGEVNSLACQFNPDEYQLTARVKYSTQQRAQQDSPIIQYIGGDITTLNLSLLFDTSDTSEIDLPLLADIPLVGALFTGQFLVTYLAILLVPLTWFLMFRTKFGMRVRIIGNNPYVASTSGIRVNRYKYMCMLLCGILAGLAGAFLSVCQMNMFVEGMSSDRGYISNVICALGSSNPAGILGASLLFGLADAAQLSLQDLNIPSQLLRMLPYCVTVVALMFVRGNRGMAAFEGKHFEEVK